MIDRRDRHLTLCREQGDGRHVGGGGWSRPRILGSGGLGVRRRRVFGDGGCIDRLLGERHERLRGNLLAPHAHAS